MSLAARHDSLIERCVLPPSPPGLSCVLGTYQDH
jgi:hypothetical protein